MLWCEINIHAYAVLKNRIITNQLKPEKPIFIRMLTGGHPFFIDALVITRC